MQINHQKLFQKTLERCNLPKRSFRNSRLVLFEKLVGHRKSTVLMCTNEIYKFTFTVAFYVMSISRTFDIKTLL